MALFDVYIDEPFKKLFPRLVLAKTEKKRITEAEMRTTGAEIGKQFEGSLIRSYPFGSPKYYDFLNKTKVAAAEALPLLGAKLASTTRLDSVRSLIQNAQTLTDVVSNFVVFVGWNYNNDVPDDFSKYAKSDLKNIFVKVSSSFPELQTILFDNMSAITTAPVPQPEPSVTAKIDEVKKGTVVTASDVKTATPEKSTPGATVEKKWYADQSVLMKIALVGIVVYFLYKKFVA